MRAYPILLAAALATFATPSGASESIQPSVGSARDATATSDGAAGGESAALARLVDPLATEPLHRSEAAGAVVVVVEHGDVVLAKGYGFADVAARRPMTADATLVHPGSISKLFTGMAVMQQVERGKLDLDRDVNAYLDFPVATPPGGVPVTLRRLLTHRAGFEEHGKNIFSTKPPAESLGAWLARSLPRRLFPSGDVSAYSNYGMSLAGYIVERVAGVPFATYMRDEILLPLGMRASTFEQPLPAALAPLMAKGYRSAARPPLPFVETIMTAPAGALAATGRDMGLFMRALMEPDHGVAGVERAARGAQPVLGAESLAQMLAPAVVTRTGFMGLAFFQTKVEEVDFVGHDGGTLTFHSRLVVSPRDRFGVFVSFDGDGGSTMDVVGAIVRHVYPAAVAAAATANIIAAAEVTTAGDRAEAIATARRTAGAYQTTRRADSTFGRFAALITQNIFRAPGDGSLLGVFPLSPFKRGPRFVRDRRGPGLFHNEKGRLLAFENLDVPGATAKLDIGPPALEWQRVPLYLDARFVLPVVAASLLIVLGTLLTWPIAIWLARRRRRRPAADGREPEPDGPPRERHARRIVRAVLGVQLATIAAALALFIRSFDFEILVDALDPVVIGLYVLAWASVVGSVVVAAVAAWFWRARAGRRWARIHHTALALATISLAWFLVTWRIAGTTLNY